MSLRIPFGFRLQAGTIDDLERFLSSQRIDLGSAAVSLFRSRLCAWALKIFDEAHVLAFAPEIAACSPLDLAWNKALAAPAGSPVDFDFDVSLMIHDGQIYGIPYCSSEDLIGRLFESGLVIPFGLKGGVSPSKENAARETDRRQEIWGKIFDSGNATPASVGQISHLVRRRDYLLKPSAADLVSLAPEFDDRVSALAYRLATLQIASECRSEPQDKVLMAIIDRVTDRKASLVPYAAGAIPRNITAEMLSAPLSDHVPALREPAPVAI